MMEVAGGGVLFRVDILLLMCVYVCANLGSETLLTRV
jgi:hypothetical protein